MRYQDKKTGAIIITDCVLYGDWVPVDDTDWTAKSVADIKAELDKQGIDYPAKAKKQELLDLL